MRDPTYEKAWCLLSEVHQRNGNPVSHSNNMPHAARSASLPASDGQCLQEEAAVYAQIGARIGGENASAGGGYPALRTPPVAGEPMLTCVPNASAESYFLLANARMAQHNYQMARQHYYRCVKCALHVCVALLHVCVALPQHIHHFPACGLLRLTCGPSQGDSSGPGARKLDGEMSVPSVRDVLIGSCSLTTDQTSLLNRVASRRSPHPSLALTRRLISTLSHAATPPHINHSLGGLGAGQSWGGARQQQRLRGGAPPSFGPGARGGAPNLSRRDQCSPRCQ